MDQPTVDDFKTYFFRDFPYGTDTDSVMDEDITRALTDAAIQINDGLFGDPAEFQAAFLNLAAHNLIMNLRASSQGVAGGFSWLESSKSVGSVSESFSVPQKILDIPQFSIYAKTAYGVKYLMMLLPYLVGAGYTVKGGTHA